MGDVAVIRANPVFTVEFCNSDNFKEQIAGNAQNLHFTHSNTEPMQVAALSKLALVLNDFSNFIVGNIDP